MNRRVLALLVALIGFAGTAQAQGQQAGAVSGRVSTADTLGVPGATVTVASPALQGARTTVTDVNGVYSLPGLPPGEYTVTFEMTGMSTVERRARVALGAVAAVDQVLSIAPVSESVVVRGTAPARPAAVTTPTAQFNIRAEEFTLLPAARTVFGLAELAPGLTDNTPNNNQVTIGGAFAYDNVFLVDGVDVNDNVLGQPNPLFIEDAIQEVQVLTSGISAEYGRFGGGVVNVVTKSGGNLFSGALRSNFSNPAWSVETPLEKSAGTTRASKLSPTYEMTLGGPVVRDRVWFFGGSRIERTTTQGTFAQTRVPYTATTDNTRYEAKLTGTVAAGHTLQGTYIDNTTDMLMPSASSLTIDPNAMATPSTLNRLFVTTWRGALTPRTFATAQYSQKFWSLRNAGNSSTNIFESPFLTRGVTAGVPASLQFNAPYFDSTDPEERNNRQLTASVTRMLASPRLGSHEVKGGFEYFVSSRVGGNSQTSTGYVFQTDYVLGADSRPALDASGNLIPRFVPGSSRVQVWQPLRGATIDVTTASLFANDHWVAAPRLTFDLGLRFEQVSSEATGGIQSVDVRTLAPRLAGTLALTADGRTVLQGGYAHYAGKYNDVQFSRNTNVGNADRFVLQYTGPAGEGVAFAPGFDPANYTVAVSGTFPTANVFFADDLRSPLTKEFTVALARDFAKGWARAGYVNRTATDFVEDFITVDGGRTTINRNGLVGTFDNAVYRNTDLARRDYQAVDVQSAYRLMPALSVNGQWTVQLQNEGNFEGESANNPAIPSLIADYPEIYVAERSFPMGRLDDFQRHKVRVWATYSFDLHQFGRLDVAPLYRYNSPRTFSLVAAAVPLTAQQSATNPGYVRLPSSQPVFFGVRGSQEFEDYALFDLAVTYGVPVWQTVRPWVKVEVLNLLNNQDLISWDTTVTADMTGAKDENGLPVSYITGPNFGKATSNGNFARPRQGMDGGRTFLLSAGIRF